MALRDIHPGEELTYDYALLNLDEPFDCLCGAAGCRRIRPDDAPGLVPRWDQLAGEAFRLLGEVEQVLWPPGA